MSGTPFNLWSTNGEPDPFGSRYDCEAAELPQANLSDVMLAMLMPSLADVQSLRKEVFLDAAKNRLRWLSRKLKAVLAQRGMSLIPLCLQRAEMPFGELTDDQLANEFYLKESHDLLQAGADRIKWLSDELKKHSDVDGA